MNQEEEDFAFNHPEFDDEDPNFPGFTEWEKTNFCCTENAIKIKKINRIFLGHWEVDLAFPIAVSTIIVTSYLVAMILVFPNCKKVGIIMAPIFSILFFLFIYSYFRVIIDGPGYFPFYWPMNHFKKNSTPTYENDESTLLHSDDLSPAGIISSQRQHSWAKSRPRPPRCTLSKEARRYVLRPDHVCGWTASWIGKRNYKFFLLFNFWGVIYISVFLIFITIEIIKQMISDIPSPVVVIFYIYDCIAIMFLFLTGSFCIQHSIQMFQNQTSWENWKSIDKKYFDEGFVKNVEDVCGPISKWYTYLLPISPWTEKTNTELVSEYPSYPHNTTLKPGE